jgi:hypothetical protein
MQLIWYLAGAKWWHYCVVQGPNRGSGHNHYAAYGDGPGNGRGDFQMRNALTIYGDGYIVNGDGDSEGDALANYSY